MTTLSATSGGQGAPSAGVTSLSSLAATDRPTVLTPAPRAEWEAVLASDPAALPEHDPRWVDAICSTGRYTDASRSYLFDDGRRFVLPLVRRTGLAGVGGWLSSYPPAWGIGGLVGPAPDTNVLRAVLEDLQGTGSQRVAVRPAPQRSDLWSAATDPASITTVPRRAHVLDLAGGLDAVLARMPSATRKYMRRAQRAGVRVEVNHTGTALDPFYDLYLASVDRWAERQHEPRALAHWRAGRRDPLSKLRTMARHLGDAFVVTMAYVDDQPAFGSIMLLGQTAHVTRSAMDIDRVGRTKAGALVHLAMIQLACAEGCTRYHLGESGQSTPLAQFKEGFGAVPVDYHEYRLERLPYTRADRAARSLVKKALRFQDT